MTLPDSLSYHVVFDMSRQPPDGWWWPVLPLVIVGVLVRFAQRPNVRWPPALQQVLVGFAFVMTFVSGIFFLIRHLEQRGALEAGNVRVVEGIVTEFIPEMHNLKHPEQFVVVLGGARYPYSYSSSLGTGGLNKSKGQIRNGLRVRITDRDGAILRLEVARDASGNALSPELAKRFPEVDFLPEIFLRLGYTTHLGYTNGMAIRFADVVSDPRVRVGPRTCSDCGVSGDAVAILELFDSEVGMEPVRLELHTNRERFEPFSDGDMVIDLTHLAPVPEINGHSFPKRDYVARLKIGRTRRGDD